MFCEYSIANVHLVLLTFVILLIGTEKKNVDDDDYDSQFIYRKHKNRQWKNVYEQ